MLVRRARVCSHKSLYSTELHSKVIRVIMVNSNVYIFVPMTLNTAHVRGKGGYNGKMILKLSQCVRVRSLHI